MFDKLDDVVKRFDELTEKLADPTIYDRQKEFKQVSEERGNIEDLVICYREYRKIKSDYEGAKEILETEKDE
ncbi:MAG: PCRF domain-containing protein, partial [Flavobacteriaceae bacterium]|nr:PCRF domain-containing protein [Flavobacteriaceae bacterium]